MSKCAYQALSHSTEIRLTSSLQSLSIPQRSCADEKGMKEIGVKLISKDPTVCTDMASVVCPQSTGPRDSYGDKMSNIHNINTT